MEHQIDQHAVPISIIVPAYNASATLSRCLEAIHASSVPGMEIIVVDDGSSDSTCAIAKEFGVRLLQTGSRQGPAGARNQGVEHANGEILMFIDADVVVQETTIQKVVERFRKHPEIAAIFGSYDESPSEPNFLSQYKNLFHHYVHQNSNENAITFWAGCGAVRRPVFIEAGGFDRRMFSRASVEDIELGLRMSERGYKILLEKSLQVKHLKRWQIVPLLKADILYRAYPWSRMIVESGLVPDDLNLRFSDRVSGLLSAFLMLLLMLLPFSIFMLPEILSLHFAFLAGTLTILVLLNIRLYAFYTRLRGWWFALRCIPWHVLYFFYSGATFAYCWLRFRALTPRSTRTPWRIHKAKDKSDSRGIPVVK